MRASQHRLDEQLNSEAQQSSSLVAQLQAMVAEREAKVRRLELEIGQLSMQVRRAPAQPSSRFPVLARPSAIQRHLSPVRTLPPAFIQGALPPAGFHLAPRSSCTHLSSPRYKPDCPPALQKTCPWLPTTQSSRAQAPSSSSPPPHGPRWWLESSLHTHIPGSRKPHSLIQLAGPHVTSSCCHPSVAFSSPLWFLHTLAAAMPFSSPLSPALSPLQACA